MKKIKTIDLPIISIHINDSDKIALTKDAERLGMTLTTYCRMILLKSLEGK